MEFKNYKYQFWNIKQTKQKPLAIFIKRKWELWNSIITLTLTSQIKEKARLVSPAISYIWKPTLDTILSTKTANTLFLNGFHRTHSHIDIVKLCIYVMVFERLLEMSYYPSPYPCQINKEKGSFFPFYRRDHQDTYFNDLQKTLNIFTMKRLKIFRLLGILLRGYFSSFSYMPSSILSICFSIIVNVMRLALSYLFVFL